MFAINIEQLKTIKYHIVFLRKIDLSIVYSKCGHEYKKIFKEECSIKILKIFGLISYIEEHQKLYNLVKNVDWKI